MHVLEKIRLGLSSLSPAEQAVAELVLADPTAFLKAPVAELARQAKVSGPTVVRFCRALGYEGLSDFRLVLAASASEGVPYVHQSVKASDGADALVHKVFDNAISTLSSYRDSAVSKPVEKAIDAIAACVKAQGKLEFYGVGNSGFVALDAQHKFFRMGCNAQAYSDGHLQIMAASMLKKSDCLIIISNSGRSEDLLEACRIARKAGATTIAVTASGSPLADLVHVHLAADHTELYEQFSPMVSRLLHLCMVDVLATGVAIRLGKGVQQNMARLKKHLIESRYAS